MPKEHFTVKLRNNVSCSRVGRRETPAGLPGQSAGECPLPDFRPITASLVPFEINCDWEHWFEHPYPIDILAN